MKFVDLRLAEPLLRAVSAEGYDTPTPIQVQAIPQVLDGKDVMGCAQTGTGKTAAFALPILHRLMNSTTAAPAGPADARNDGHRSHQAHSSRKVRCLVLCPTRELALQIQESFRTYGKNLPFRSTVIFGGVSQYSQVQALRAGVDILVATPGRLLDLMNQRLVDLKNVDTLVLDEADRMLDMGFIHDIRRIVAQVPSKRQTLLFSATMPAEIRQLANSLLHNPVSVQVTPPATTVESVNQSVYFVDRANKPVLLAHLFNALPMSRAIVFTRTKHGADRVVRQLHIRGIRAEAIHGNKSQNARERALANFRASKTPILVATDIASRGIDVDGISHVVNYDLTHEPETYVHRIGRTARAGASGAAVSFCDREEVQNLKAIEKLIRQSIPVKKDHPEYKATEQQPSQQSSRPSNGASAASHSRPQHGERQSRPQHGERPSRPQHAKAGSRNSASAGSAHKSSTTHSHSPTATAAAPRTHARHPLHGGFSRRRRPAR